MRNKYTTEELYRIQKTITSSSGGEEETDEVSSVSENIYSEDSGLKMIAKYVDISNANIYAARILKHADEYYNELSEVGCPEKEGATIINRRAVKINNDEENFEKEHDHHDLAGKMACCLYKMCGSCKRLIKSDNKENNNNNNIQVTVKPPGTFARMADMAKKAEDLQVSFKMLRSLRSALPDNYEKELYDSLNSTSSTEENKENNNHNNHNIDREKCLKLKDLFNSLANKYSRK